MLEGLSIFYLQSGDEAAKAYDISDVTESVSISTTLEPQPGKLSLTVVSENVEYSLGSIIQVMLNDKGIFWGYIFDVSFKHNSSINIIAYDQTRYLRNEDTIVLEAMSLDVLFRKICKDTGLPAGDIDKSSYVSPAIVHDGKSYWDMLSHALDLTYAYDKEPFIIRDNYGKIELKNLKNLHSGVVLDDEAIIQTYDYSTSIDKETYNRVVIVSDNDKKSNRSRVVEEDKEAVKRWGRLQTLRTTSNRDKAAIKRQAEALLTIHARPTHTLSLDCIGDFRVCAGNLVTVKLGVLEITEGEKTFIVKGCTHSLSNSQHTMKVDLETRGL